MKALLEILQTSIILVSIAFGQIYDNNAKYVGAVLMKIEKTPFVTDILRQRNIDIWSASRTFYDILVKKSEVDEMKLLLQLNNILYTVMDKHVAETIRKHDIQNNGTSMRSLTDPNIPTFKCYQKVEEIYGYLNHLAKRYPKIASVGIIGYTIKRKPLKYIKISSGYEHAKAFVIDGGIHAREWIAPAAVTFIIKQLVENRQELPSELLNLDFYALPLFNPDGYEYSYKKDRLWRKNRSKNGQCYGVDINRNFEVEFGGKGTSKNPCKDDYHGRRAHSEKETQAFAGFIKSLEESLTGYVTFHSYGQYILIPFGFDTGSHPRDFDELKRVGDKAASAMNKIYGTHYEVGNTAELLYPAAGGSDDWVKRCARAKYVYTIELRDSGKYGFVLPKKLIIPTAIEAFEAIKVIASAAYRTQEKYSL